MCNVLTTLTEILHYWPDHILIVNAVKLFVTVFWILVNEPIVFCSSSNHALSNFLSLVYSLSMVLPVVK